MVVYARVSIANFVRTYIRDVPLRCYASGCRTDLQSICMMIGYIVFVYLSVLLLHEFMRITCIPHQLGITLPTPPMFQLTL